MTRKIILLPLSLACLLVLLLLPVAAFAQATVAVSASDIDLAATQAFNDGKPLGSPTAEVVNGILGPSKDPAKWDTGTAIGTVRAFRIAFKQPIELGSVFSRFAVTAPGVNSPTMRRISFLKADAPYPGDVTVESQWTEIRPGLLSALPVGTKTRALRFVDPYHEPETFPSRMALTILLKERYYNAMDVGQSKLSGVPNKPETWLGAWNDPVTIDAILFAPINVSALNIETLKLSSVDHPIVADKTDWKDQTPLGITTGTTIYRMATPVSTRGLRLTSPTMGTSSGFGEVVPLVDLGTLAEGPTMIVPPAPFKIHYDMPMNGFVAIEIHDKATGKLVRRLVSETERGKGPIEEPWDLKDDIGQIVPPGEYTWKGIARPPFKLTYEMTVNNAGQPAWWAPQPGKGGGSWMADHSAPIASCAVGNYIFLGSPVAESGNSSIAVDLEGNKVWGQSVAGFDGTQRLAGDDRFGYLLHASYIKRVDTQNKFEVQNIFTPNFPHDLPGAPIAGAATHDGKLYVSYDAAPVSWLTPSFPSDVMDPTKSVPLIQLVKGSGHRQGHGERNYGEAEYDELMKFYSSFLVDYTPKSTPTMPNAFIPSSTQAYFGDAPQGGVTDGSLMLALKQPVTVGTIMVPDARIKVWALKPTAKLPDVGDVEPGDADLLGGGGGAPSGGGGGELNEDDWISLPVSGKPGFPGMVQTPEGGLKTVALRFKIKRMPFALITAHRMADLAGDATRVFTEGAATEHGGWQIDRDASNPLTPSNPARMALVWKTPVKLRGISLLQPTPNATTLVDTFIGPDTADPQASLADDSMWREVGRIEPEVFNGYFAQPATQRSVDFGDSIATRALRIVAIEPQGYRNPPYGISAVTGVNHAGFDSVVAYTPLGSDPELPPELSQRITEFQLPAATDKDPQATIIRHIPIANPGFLAFDKAGTLYAESGNSIVTVPLDGSGKPKVVIAADEMERVPAGVSATHQADPYDSYTDSLAVGRFTGMAFAPDGSLFVGDRGPQVIKVFDVHTGKQIRIVGTPGGLKLGAWDPTRMENPVGLTFDSAGKLWVAESRWQPKRISRWSADGTFEKDFMGPTGYGGGGKLDEGNKNVLNFDGMKFLMDWNTMTWKLDDILFCQGLKGSTYGSRPDQPVYYKGTRYLVGDPVGGYFNIAVATIAVEKNGVAVPMVAAGNFGLWDDVNMYPDLKKKFGNLQREGYGFVWCDKNGDGIPEADEVQITDKNLLKPPGNCKVGDDLSLNFGAVRMRPTGFTPAGVPLYDLSALESTPELNDQSWTTSDGRTFVVGNKLVAADGKTVLWSYPDNFLGGGGYYAAAKGYDRPAGFLLGENQVVGHFKVGNEEYFVNNSDQSDWFTYTADGLLVGCIFGGPSGYGLRQWTMPEWTPGKVNLDDLRLGQEHYQGCVVKADDGNVYAVAGHNHNSVVRIDGFDQLQRIGGAVSVGVTDIDAAQAWALKAAAVERMRREPKVAKMPYLPSPVAVDGSLDDWPDDLFVNINDYWVHSLYMTDFVIQSQGALAFDSQNLYIAAWALQKNPMANASQDPKMMFKGGDAVDVLLGMDPTADPKRTTPVAGDIRLLLSTLNGKPTVVVYQPIAPGSPPTEHGHFTSPVGVADMDRVAVINDAQLVVRQDADGKGNPKWVLEAAVPWKSIGVAAPKLGTKIRGDIGILVGDQNGVRTVNRLYWSGKSQTVVSDIPSEARINPSVWGELYLKEPDAQMKFGPDDSSPLGGGDLNLP